MQTDHGISSSKPQMPVVELDDFDIDGLGFKPINKGLGFHGERETKTQKRQVVSKPSNRSLTPSSALNSSLQHTTERIPLDNPMGGLEHFYNVSAETPKLQKVEKVILKNERVEAKLISRLCAYILDCSVVLMTSLFVFGLFVLTLYSAVGSSLIKSFIVENLDFFILLNGVIYIIYFSMWDAVGTFGKLVMGIEVKTNDESSYLSMTQLFNRSVLSLFGLMLLSIPNILDIHTKLSRTSTVEK